MKLRKHKNNKTFKITFSTRSPNRVETHVNSDGTTRKVIVEGAVSPRRSILAVGSCWQSVRNAFLFGRDENNTEIFIRFV